MPNLVTGFPRQTGDLQKDYTELYDWAVSLIDELKALLNNLDAGNIVEVEAEKVKNLPEVINEIVGEIPGGNFDGETLILDSFYDDWAEIGEIRNDGYSTSQAPYLYLANNTADDIFTEIDAYGTGHESAVYFHHNAVKYDENTNEPLTQAMIDRYGNAVYWKTAIDTVVNGVPYDADGNRVLMTRSEITDYPVTVYQYEDAGTALITQLTDGIELTYNSGASGAETKGLKLTSGGAYQTRGQTAYSIPVLKYFETAADAGNDTTLRNGDFAAVKDI